MPLSTGFNPVGTVTSDLDRIVDFYQSVFEAMITFEMAARKDHPRMVILDLGCGALTRSYDSFSFPASVAR